MVRSVAVIAEQRHNVATQQFSKLVRFESCRHVFVSAIRERASELNLNHVLENFLVAEEGLEPSHPLKDGRF